MLNLYKKTFLSLTSNLSAEENKRFLSSLSPHQDEAYPPRPIRCSIDRADPDVILVHVVLSATVLAIAGTLLIFLNASG